jgi:hypothetical protein
MIPSVGDRIVLLAMPDDPCPIELGSTGTVTGIHAYPGFSTQVSVAWDNGRTLMLCIPPDKVRVLEETTNV